MSPDTSLSISQINSSGGGYSSGISIIGWILAAATVAIAYQFKPARPILTGVILLVLLGMLLRSTSTVTNQFKSIFKG